MNNGVIVGRFASDPELKYTPSGVGVLKVSVAVQRKFKQDGEYKADFFQVEAWDKVAAILSEHVSKGDMVALQGRLENNTWQTQSGEKRTMTKIVVENFSFLPNTRKGSGSGGGTEAPGTSDEYDPFAFDG